MSDAADIGKRFIEKIDALAKAGKFYGFSIWPSSGGFQVNLATTAANNWRVRTTETPSEGIDLVCGMDFMDEHVFKTKQDEPEMLAPPLVDEPPLEDHCACGGGDASGHDALCPEAAEQPDDTGIFD